MLAHRFAFQMDETPSVIQSPANVKSFEIINDR